MSRRTKQRKKAQGYEQYPPKCSSCRHFQRRRDGIPGVRPFSPPACGLGEFAVNPNAICDMWVGLDGSKLETAS